MTQDQTAQPSMFCRKCGYQLTGLSESRCPECGMAFEPGDSSTFDRQVWQWQFRSWRRRLLLLVVAIVAIMMAVLAWLHWRWWAEHRSLRAVYAINGTAGIRDARDSWARIPFGFLPYLFKRAEEVYLLGPAVDDAWMPNVRGLHWTRQLRDDKSAAPGSERYPRYVRRHCGS